MKQGDTERLQALAWQQAWQSRCCPPTDLLRQDPPGPGLNEHLAFCPWCMALRTSTTAPIQGPQIVLPHHDVLPQAGELWMIRPDRGGWGEKGRYYAPPLVLVVALPSLQMVSVVQLHDISSFSGKDEVYLGPKYVAYAEPWNRYTLGRDFLASCVGRVDDHLLDQARTLAQSPPSLAVGSLQWFFRNMEVETGHFFARQCLAQLLAQETAPIHTAIDSSLLLPSSSILIEDLEGLGLIPWRPVDTSQGIELLASFTQADQHHPLAADHGRIRVEALGFALKDGRLTAYSPFRAQVTVLEQEAGILAISGLLADTIGPASQFFCFWRNGPNLLAPLPGQFGIEAGVFWAMFPHDGPQPPTGELLIRILGSD